MQSFWSVEMVERPSLLPINGLVSVVAPVVLFEQTRENHLVCLINLRFDVAFFGFVVVEIDDPKFFWSVSSSWLDFVVWMFPVRKAVCLGCKFVEHFSSWFVASSQRMSAQLARTTTRRKALRVVAQHALDQHNGRRKSKQIALGVMGRKVKKFVGAGARLAMLGAFTPSVPLNLLRAAHHVQTSAGKSFQMKQRPTLADRGGQRDLLLPNPNIKRPHVKS